MRSQTRNHWFFLTPVCFLFSILIISGCTPEKNLNPADRITPIGWLNEDTLLIADKGAIRIVTSGKTQTLYELPNDFDQNVIVSPCVRKNILTFLKANTPYRNFLETSSSPDVRVKILLDEDSGGFKVLETSEESYRKHIRCPQWSSPSSTEALSAPSIDKLLWSPFNIACFTCGCECSTTEYIYLKGGKTFVHIAGDGNRGLYVSEFQPGGKRGWKQLISGRLEVPLAISPSGCKVAYYKVSYSGNSLEQANVCETKN